MMPRWRRVPSLLVAAAAVAAALACGGAAEAPPEDEDLAFLFAEPRRVDVVAGDTLAGIAERERCTVDELRYWNGLASDVIAPGDVLMVWDSATGERARPKTGADYEAPPEVAEAPAPPAPAPEPSSWNPIRRWVFGTADEAPPPEVAAAPDAGVAPAPPAGQPPARPAVELRPAGVLGVDLDEGGSPDLAAASRGMQRHDSEAGAERRTRSFEDGGTAETIDVGARQGADYGGVQIPNTPVSPPRLAMPAAKRCLSGPTEADLRGEQDFAGNRGLDEAQIRAGMSKVVRSSAQCFPSGTSGSYTVIVEIQVGCDGLVDAVSTVSAGPVPSHVTSCVEATMAYAGFAAHATPNGVAFQYPLKYTF